MPPFNALVLAGSRGGVDPVASFAGVSDKALIDIGGMPMLQRVVEALRAAGAERIGVSASSEPVVRLAADLGCEMIPAESGPSASAAQGFARIGAPMLLTTADHALLRPAWITDFLSQVPPDADVAACLARRERIEADVPDTRRTYLRFADGAWSGCNLFYFATQRAAAAFDLWQQVERDRKRPWRIVTRLGPAMLVRYLLGQLTLQDALARLGKRAGLSAAAVESPHGLAAVDVDKPDDLVIARRLVR